MAQSYNTTGTSKLTLFEEEVMMVLWQKGARNVHQVINSLPSERKKSYTSVSTILRILEGKEFVSSYKEGPRNIYSAIYSQEDYAKQSLQHLITHGFSNQPIKLVNYLINNNLLSDQDFQYLEALINAKGGL